MNCQCCSQSREFDAFNHGPDPFVRGTFYVHAYFLSFAFTYWRGTNVVDDPDHNFGVQLPHFWTTVTNAGAFGTDYRTRAAVAKSNVFINRNHETKYFYQDFDAQGVRLSGERSYRVTFAPGRPPPAKGFWSLTLYNDKHTFHPNEWGCYSIGTKSKNLQFGEDGTLTIWIQDKPPAADKLSNWLPSPEGPFSLYLRAYWPERELLEGAWSPPPVMDETPDVRIAREGLIGP